MHLLSAVFLVFATMISGDIYPIWVDPGRVHFWLAVLLIFCGLALVNYRYHKARATESG